MECCSTGADSYQEKSNNDFDKVREGNVYYCRDEAIFGGERSVRYRDVYKMSS